MLVSMESGKIECLDSVSTIADGIKVKEPGVNTFDCCQKYVDEIVTVTDDEISSAILALIEQHKLIAEGAGAVSVAAAMFNKVPIKGKKTVCLVSGGNIDVTILSRVIKRGLLKSGRSDSINIDINGCYLRIVLETRNFEHKMSIRKALADAGFKIVE